jgi:hypothetical protein
MALKPITEPKQHFSDRDFVQLHGAEASFEKLIVAWVVKKLSTFYGPQRFTIVFTRALH